MTSLRHPACATDYSICENLFAQTLRSIHNQSCEDFQTMVVCNQAPTGLTYDNVHIEQVNFPPVDPSHGLHGGHLDRGRKFVIGLRAAKKLQPDYVMFFDSDDFVHRDLVRYVSDHGSDEQPGWFFPKGYSCNHALTLYSRQISPYPGDTFQMRCGTSHIMHFGPLYDALRELPADTASLHGRQDYVISELLANHLEFVNFFKMRGTPLLPLPFPGAILRMGTGENSLSASFDGPSWPISHRMRYEFGMDSRPYQHCLKDWVRDWTTKACRKLSGEAGWRREAGQ